MVAAAEVEEPPTWAGRKRFVTGTEEEAEVEVEAEETLVAAVLPR